MKSSVLVGCELYDTAPPPRSRTLYGVRQTEETGEIRNDLSKIGWLLPPRTCRSLKSLWLHYSGQGELEEAQRIQNIAE